ncbi:MAG: VIT1/CCC1 transporter family protein [Bacteroidales bacterium]
MEEIPLHELKAFQRHELNAALIYRKLAAITKDEDNRKIMFELSDEQWSHCLAARKATGKKMRPNNIKIIFYYILTRIFGLTFGIKLMEYNNSQDKDLFQTLAKHPDYEKIIEEGEKKEKLLINQIEEERLYYMGAVIIGLNDALIEFTGALAGFALAFQNHKVVAMAGAITGIAGALSMGASEYMASKTEKNPKTALKSSVYTFSAYFTTIVLLLFPFIILHSVYLGLATCILIMSLIIAAFNFYYAVTRDKSFWKRFREMFLICISITFISFGIGWLLKYFTGINL